MINMNKIDDSDSQEQLNNFLIDETQLDISSYLKEFSVFGETKLADVFVENQKYPIFINEFWTSKQRQASSIQEISYRACFKPQLPNFFIKLLSKEDDLIYDPFGGRGTTIIESALLKRRGISNDISPLSEILAKPRLSIPKLDDIKKRLDEIPIDKNLKAEIDLSMFYHQDTEAEIVSLKNYLHEKMESGKEDEIDQWIRMVATNRLTGHSSGFFSVYTLPPNQAVSRESQTKINIKRNQIPKYRNTKKIIISKTEKLMSKLSHDDIRNLNEMGKKAIFLTKDARDTKEIDSESVQLTITSPPFLDIVQYTKDNWLRCWFNSIDDKEISKKITILRSVDEWSKVMGGVFRELFRITRKGGWVAFEVGEVRKGKIKLDEYVIPLGLNAGFRCEGVLINLQIFTKTSNIWGINNNHFGTNTNRIVLFKKEV